MTPPGHVMILASAGSGKTYALTDRFIGLLARGAAPDRIVALTFTRKAAGEFFDRILNKLAAAAADPAAARRLDAAIGWEGREPEAYRRLLRGMVDAMPRLRLGTLDGFFARIVRAFPLELGLAGDFEVLQEHAARLERRRVLRRLYLPVRGGPAEAQKNFIEAFKRATFGADEKRLATHLDTFLDEHHRVYLTAASGAGWGEAARIWPSGQPWLEAGTALAPALRTLESWLASATLDPSSRRRWAEFLEAVPTWAPGASLPRPLEYVLEKTLPILPALLAGSAELKFNRQAQALPAAAARALGDVVQAIAAAELSGQLAVTRGIFEVLRDYDRLYHDTVRRGGKLTFADIQRLLEPMRLSAIGGEPEAGRLAIDYRLDGEIDHWLLDEFQDTSFGQWSILRNLVDEAVQDPTGRRTFFCVGDVKQAIYTWRGGDPRIFREVLEYYNAAAPGTVVEKFLDSSWRSGPPVIELVNAVFGASAVLHGLFPGAAAATWTREWRTHRSAVPDRNGQAALIHAAGRDGRWRTTLELLRELAPGERGLSCAVLVRQNDTAAELADYLRAEGGFSATAEADLRVCVDHPAGAALLALVQAAAHPGDRLAWEHVRMSPLAAVLGVDGIGDRDALALAVLGSIFHDGFARTMEFWLKRLEPADRFSRERADQFAAAAAAFDATGSRNPDEFIEFMGRFTLRDTEGGAVVRVMTIHKAKGLDFDVVVVPDLEGHTLLSRREGLAVHESADRSIDWVLDLPPRLFSENDAVLGAHVCDARAAACYEQLSLLYVALTRAKRGLYVVTEPVGASSSANFPQFLARTLGCEERPIRVGAHEFAGSWSRGDPEWFRGLPPPAPASRPVPGLERLAGAASNSVLRRRVRRPSLEDPSWESPARLFRLERSRESDFGRRVHELLARIAWADPAERAARAADWAAQGGAPDAEAAACLTAAGLAAIWASPDGAAEVWRERDFEVIAEEAWVSGRFDRVVVSKDSAGRPTAAVVYDFKTDRAESPANWRAIAERHAGQLATYRRAVCALTGLPAAAVRAEVVLTRARARFEV